MKKDLLNDIDSKIKNIQAGTLNPENWSLTDTLEYKRLEELIKSKGLDNTWQFQNLHNFLKQKKYENNNGVTAIFKFPDHLKTSCEQYLTYFAEFLKDIGVHTNVSMEGRGYETFFKTVPKDSKQALRKIQEALIIYLSIPVASESEFQSLKNHNAKYRMAFEKLKIQNTFLKQQIKLNEYHLKIKNDAVKNKNEVIRAKDSHIDDLKHNLKMVLIFSLKVIEIQGKPLWMLSRFAKNVGEVCEILKTGDFGGRTQKSCLISP